MMQKNLIFSFCLIVIVFLDCTKTLGQGPAAAPAKVPPAPSTPTTPSSDAPAAMVQPLSGPRDIMTILQKASHFSTFMRLLQATQEDLELNNELTKSKNRLTIFAPKDSAFSNLKAGFLNSLDEKDKIELVKFHVVTEFIPPTQFQTVSNPVRTQAGTGDRVSINVTTTGSIVNVTTGVTNATVSGIVYTDDRLGVYEVDKLLLPLDLFAPKPPAPAPTAAGDKPKKKGPDGAAAESPDAAKDASGAMSVIENNKNLVFFAVGIVAAMFS